MCPRPSRWDVPAPQSSAPLGAQVAPAAAQAAPVGGEAAPAVAQAAAPGGAEGEGGKAAHRHAATLRRGHLQTHLQVDAGVG